MSWSKVVLLELLAVDDTERLRQRKRLHPVDGLWSFPFVMGLGLAPSFGFWRVLGHPNLNNPYVIPNDGAQDCLTQQVRFEYHLPRKRPRKSGT